MSKPLDLRDRQSKIAHLPLTQLAQKLRDGSLTSKGLTQIYLDRIQTFSDLNAFITVNESSALSEAARLDALLAAGTDLGPLHGMPIAVKDNLDTVGVKTTGGSAVLANHIPQADATVITKLKAAGAIILGKTNMHEFAFGITSQNPHYGAVKNPHHASAIPGGSSGGSAAAVAAGLCAAALGTDTGASIRLPAALCGVVGLKPTLGRVGRGGLMYLSHTCDCIGPITRSADDAALVLNAIAGEDPLDRDTANQPHLSLTDALHSWEGVRLGVDRDAFLAGNHPDIEKMMEEVLGKIEAAGGEIVDISIWGMEETIPSGFGVVLPETTHLLSSYLKQVDPPTTIEKILSHVGTDVAGPLGSQIGEAPPVPAFAYLDITRGYLPTLREKLAETMKGLDGLILPVAQLPPAEVDAAGTVAFMGERVDAFSTYVRHTIWVNLVGNPAITLKGGVNREGLPLGFQLVGQRWDESKIIHLGKLWERD
ncbi:MAG: amidase [Chloroflexota bacterium]